MTVPALFLFDNLKSMPNEGNREAESIFMKKVSYILLAILLTCLCSTNKAKCELLHPDLSVLSSELLFRDLSLVSPTGISGEAALKSVGDGWQQTIKMPGFIRTKSPVPLKLTGNSSDNSLLSVRAINKTKVEEGYKYDIELVYDGAIWEQNNFTGQSEIKIEQESNDEYQYVSQSIQLKFEQKGLFFARVLHYDETMGTVSCSAGGSFPPGYPLDDNCKNITFSFWTKKGYRLKDVKINGVSKGKITSYVASIGKNYQIEPIWEKKPETYTVKVTYLDGGNVKVDDQSITYTGQSVTVSADADVKITIIPYTDYHIQQVKLGNEDVTDRVNNNVLTILSISADQEIDVKFEKDVPKTYTVKITCSEGGSVRVNDQFVTTGQSVTVVADSNVKIAIMPQNDYHIKYIKQGATDVTNQLSNNVLTISSISADQEIDVKFEEDVPKTYTIKITYSSGGSVKVNNQSISSNQSTTVTALTDVKITITPLVGYHIKQVQLGNDDVTGQLNNNILTISSISTDKDIKVIFEKDASITHSVKVTYSAGGSVKVNNQSVTSGQSATVTASTDVKVTITSQIGYHIKQVRLGTKDVTNQLENNVLTISSILENEEITVAFELNIHTINVTYNESGTVQVDGLSVVSEQSVKVNALSNVKIMITPQTGYHIKQVLLDNKDVFSQLNNNVLTLSSITANKELIITFEKDAPINHTIKLAYSSGGSVKVNDQSLMSGQSFTVAASTDVKVTLTPQSGYRIRQIKLGSEDVTNQLSNNILTISAISANVELSISFEQIPTYKLNISMTGEAGSIKIGDKVITESTLISDIKEESSICINFQPSKYYNIKSIILEDKDITDQIQNGSYTIESMKSNLTLKIEYIRKQYALLIDIQGTDKIKINGKDVTNGSSIIINSGYNRIDISSEYYLIKQVLLDNKIINEGSGSYIEISMDSDKKLTIIAELREKREVSLTSEEPGTLASHLSEEDMKMVTDLNISGEIDQRDFLVLNQMQSLYKLSLRVTIGEYKNYPANTIPENAFHNNKTIKMIYLSNSIEAIGKQAFLGSAISYIEKYAENYKYLTKIGEESFKDCQCLTQIPSLYNISVIEKGTFENCSNLTTLSTVLTNLKEIKEAAFRNCKNLSITLESGLERIGDYAFENVKNVEIPRGEDTKIELSHIGINALKGCQEDMFNFDNYHNLKELPCFEGCNKLASVTFPPDVKEIPEGTFKGCTSLAYVKMNESIERIAENAFIDSKAISELFVPVNTTPEIYANSFSDLTYYVAKLLVPADQLPFYRNHPVWGKFANIEPIGVATNRQFELSLTAGGFVEIKGDKGIYFDDTFYYEGTNESSYLTSSRIELIITPNQGYLIESVYLNGKNITNELDENNLYVIPYLLVDSKLEVKFKKDNTTGIEMINTDKRVYLSGTNQLFLIGFQVGVHVFIYDAGGRIVRQTMISGSVEKIDLPGRGIYFIRVDKDTFKIAF